MPPAMDSGEQSSPASHATSASSGMLATMPAAAARVDPSCGDGIASLGRLLSGQRVVVLTGAGCSTESGIPDYRGAGRPPRTRAPIQHDAFLRHPEVRHRYWARATLGWARFSAAAPNPAHRALAALERAGAVTGVITQNVDRLHQQAGSRRVIELHGALADVVCLSCGDREPRAALQLRLVRANPGWVDRAADMVADGDADLPDADLAAFRVPACLACGGVLKPDVVFFGGNVGRPTLDAAFELLDAAQVLLVVGSSLAVYSGYRFAVRARDRGIGICVINLGATRADGLACLRVERRAGEALSRLAQVLGVTTPGV
jgi:NAD+-dependent protein deacetylase sirtuin 4